MSIAIVSKRLAGSRLFSTLSPSHSPQDPPGRVISPSLVASPNVQQSWTHGEATNSRIFFRRSQLLQVTVSHGRSSI